MLPMEDLIAVILGGGAGTRLFPLTGHRAKPAVPLAGKYRIIDVPVSNCINSDINRIFVLTQYNSASLNRHIARTFRFDQFRSGFVSVLAAEQTLASREWFQGTADAVRRSLTHMKGYRFSHVLILSGDQLYSMNYRKMLAHHLEHEADITIAANPVSALHAPSFGIMKTNDEQVITEFNEKPSSEELSGKESPVSEEMKAQGREYLASMGIYIFSKKMLLELLESYADAHDFGKEIIPPVIDTHRVVCFPFPGYWSDIGTIRSYFDANLMLAQQQPPFTLYDAQMQLYTNARMLPPAKIQSSFIQDAIIAEGSVVINSQITNSVIGLRAYIGHNTTIKNSVILGADYYRWYDPEQRNFLGGPDQPGIDSESYIEGAIIDKNVSVGHRCIIKNRDHVEEGEGPNFYIRDHVVVIPKNAVIPDDTLI